MKLNRYKSLVSLILACHIRPISCPKDESGGQRLAFLQKVAEFCGKLNYQYGNEGAHIYQPSVEHELHKQLMRMG